MSSDDESADPPFDVLSYSLGRFTNLTDLALPWQPNITSLKECSKLPNLCKMKRFTLIQIPEMIPAIEVADFINKHLEANGYMCLSFLIPTPKSYYQEIKSLVTSKKFQLKIEHKPAQGFILRP